MNVIAKVIRVAIYIRVSHEEQARNGLSLDAQIKTLKKYAKEKGWKIVDIYADEGITARKKLSKRKEFQRLMGDVKADKIDMIIFIKLDRWFRNVPDYYKTQEVLDAHNVGWKATEEEYDTTTANGRLHLNIKLSIAQNESDQTSDRINFVFENRRSEGYVTSGAKKMCYDIVDKKYTINEKEAEIMNDLYDYCYEHNGSITETMYYYNASHEPVIYDTMKKWLTDTAYINQCKKYKSDEVIPNYTPRIMSDEKFYKVQNLIQKRIRTEKGTGQVPETLFDGLLYCPKCESKCSRKISHVSGKEYISYACWKSAKRSPYERKYQCENGHSINQNKVEKYLLDNFKKLAEDYITKNTIVETIKPKKKKNNSEAIKKKLNRLQSLFIEDLIDMDEYKKRYETLQNELQSITDETKEEKPKDLSKIKKILNEDVQGLYDSLDLKKRKQFWLNTIDKIFVEHVEIVDVAFL